MNEEPAEKPPSLETLGMDLERSFQPAWTKQIDSQEEKVRLIERHGHGEGGQHSGRDGGPRKGFQNRRARPGQKDHQGGGRREFPARQGDGVQPGERRPGHRRDDHGRGRDSGRDRGYADRGRARGRDGRDQQSSPYSAPPMLGGWDLHFLPEPAGVDGLARQIKHSLKAYPLFDLARLVLEKPDRYRVRLTRKDGPALWQVVGDGSLWLSEEAAMRHACDKEFDKVFSIEETSVDPPKGNFTCVARCSLSGTLIAPPNHHDYQTRLVRLHAARFSRMPFASFQRQIQMVRDEEVIEKWKQEQSVKREFVESNPAADVAPLRFKERADAMKHLRLQRRADLILDPGSELTISATEITVSEAPLQNFVRQAWEKLVRFPLPLSLELGRELAALGCATFKLENQIVYAGVVRPRPLDRVATPVSDTLAGILDAVAEHADAPRPEQWQAMLAKRPLESENDEARKARDHAVLSDLHWLLSEGYLVDFAGRGFAPGSAPLRKKKKSPSSGNAEQQPQEAPSPQDPEVTPESLGG